MIKYFPVIANSKDSNGNLATAVLKKGDKFGERDVVAMETRTSTVVCQDFTTLFAVHKKVCFSNRNKVYNFSCCLVCSVDIKKKY